MIRPIIAPPPNTLKGIVDMALINFKENFTSSISKVMETCDDSVKLLEQLPYNDVSVWVEKGGATIKFTFFFENPYRHLIIVKYFDPEFYQMGENDVMFSYFKERKHKITDMGTLPKVVEGVLNILND
jgi:hypothetical protein